MSFVFLDLSPPVQMHVSYRCVILVVKSRTDACPDKQDIYLAAKETRKLVTRTFKLIENKIC